MDPYISVAQTVAVALGVGVLSGINLYAVALVLGIGAALSFFPLPATVVLLTHPAVIIAALIMYWVDFFAEKIPSFDARWDALQGAIKILGGAVLACGMLGPHEPWLGALVCAGAGILAAFAHVASRSVRLLIPQNHFLLWGFLLTLVEDLLVAVATALAIIKPTGFVPAILIFVAAAAVFLMRYQELPKQLIVQIKQRLKPQPITTSAVLVEAIKPPSRPLTHTELVSSLERLERLKSTGALTAQEFEQQKQRLITAG